MDANRTLHVMVKGEGKPTLLFVHGFCCALGDWKAQIEALSPSFRCVALDLPGHGASGLPRESTLAALGAAVNEAKEESAGAEVILVGHSLGSKVIREAYAQSNAGVVGLVFIEGAFYAGDGAAVVKKARDAIDRTGFVAYARRHFMDMFVEGSAPELRDSIVARLDQVNPDFGRDLYLQAVGWDSVRGKETLQQIRVPVLVLQSTYMDAQLRRQALQPGIQTPFMQLVAATLPGSDIRAVPGRGHFLMNEAPELVNNELRAFATRVSRSSR